MLAKEIRVDAPHFPRHPKNAPGPFYVVQDECITCGAPRQKPPR